MNDPGERRPATFESPIDLPQRSRGVSEVTMVVDIEKAERLEMIAKKLGGFSVSITAQGGDSEGKVTVKIKNEDPNRPNDLDRFWARVNEKD